MMRVRGRFIFGTLGKWFGRLHYRYEVKPYAEARGHTREKVLTASLQAHERLFCDAWPAPPQEPTNE